MIILGIETSCDETAISIIRVDENGSNIEILGNTVLSQMKLHAPYGGVFPVLAKREHQKNLVPVLVQTLKHAKLFTSSAKPYTSLLQNTRTVLEMESELLTQFEEVIPTIERPNIDLISVTSGPGLEPALWVGINFARALGLTWNIPVVPVNHMEGHILVSLLNQNVNKITVPKFPALALLLSGGHTEIIYTDKIGSYKKISETRDDAVGECFDKVARTLGLTYPGGPEISKLAKTARVENIKLKDSLPRPMIHSDDLDFSFSGLKTSVLYYTKEHKINETLVKAISREVEEAITDVIVVKTKKAIEDTGAQTLIIGGGVVANEYIREALKILCEKIGIEILLPHVDHSTDNALMIALAGYFEKDKAQNADIKINAFGNLSL